MASIPPVQASLSLIPGDVKGNLALFETPKMKRVLLEALPQLCAEARDSRLPVAVDPRDLIAAYAVEPEKSLLGYLVNSPAGLINSLGIMEGYRNIRECNCFEFDRKAFGVRFARRSIEEGLATLLQADGHKSDDWLTIADVGAGGCFQGLVFMTQQLIRAGRTKIRLVAIDNCYEKGYRTADGSASLDSIRSVEELRQLVEKEMLSATIPGLEIIIESRTNLEEYLQDVNSEKVPRPNVILMIDSEDDTVPEKVVSTLFQKAMNREKTFVGFTFRETQSFYGELGPSHMRLSIMKRVHRKPAAKTFTLIDDRSNIDPKPLSSFR